MHWGESNEDEHLARQKLLTQQKDGFGLLLDPSCSWKAQVYENAVVAPSSRIYLHLGPKHWMLNTRKQYSHENKTQDQSYGKVMGLKFIYAIYP